MKMNIITDKRVLVKYTLPTDEKYRAKFFYVRYQENYGEFIVRVAQELSSLSGEYPRYTYFLLCRPMILLENVDELYTPHLSEEVTTEYIELVADNRRASFYHIWIWTLMVHVKMVNLQKSLDYARVVLQVDIDRIIDKVFLSRIADNII